MTRTPPVLKPNYSASLVNGISGVGVQSKQVITNIPSLDEVEQPLTTAEGLLVQQPAPIPALAQITGVQLKPTDQRLEVILETTGTFDEVLTSETDNSLITDIPNAQLRLPNSGAFRQDNPTQDIVSVEVTNIDSKTLRVTVTGKVGVPTAEVSQSPQALILSVVAPVAPQPTPPVTPAPGPPPAVPQQPEPPEELAPSLEPQADEERLELTVTAEEEAGGYFVPDATTATKTDTPLRDIPQSIQVVPQRVIEDQKILRISDAVRNVSGVTPQGGYAGATDNYNIRGFTTYDNLRNGFNTQDNFVNPTNIERIEVLKGPASVLYGQFEPGGVVNYITKQPLSEPYYSAEFTAGSFSTYRPSIDISGPLNADKTLLYRLNAAYENAGNFVDFVDQDVFAIAPTLTYKIGDATTLALEYEYLNVDRTFYDGLPPDPIVFEAPISRFLGEPEDRISRETHFASFSVNHRFSENIRLRSGFSSRVENSEESEFRPNAIDSDGRTVLRRFAAGPGYTQNYSLQTDLISDFNTGPIQHQVLLGLELNKYINGYDYLRSSDSLTPSIDLFDPVYGAPPPPEFDEAASRERYDRNTIGLYLQDQVTLLPNLKLLVGGRYDFVHRRNRFQTLDSLGQDPIDDATVERIYDGAFSPRIGIVYQPISPISIYASYSRSFNPNSAQTVDRTQLPPERGTQYEVGIRAETLGGRLLTTLAAYEITKSNVATPDPDPDNIDFSVAAGEVKSRGIEFDVAGEILPGWNVIGSTYLNDAFVSEDNDLPVGDTLVNAPHVGASLWTTYEIQSGGLQGLGFGAGLFFVGDREAELPNTFEIPSFVRADASIFYRLNNYRIGLNFKNLFGTKYYESQGFYLRPGAPFTVLGTVSVEF